jgi:uncharacterized repeat protein (TIGR01451 family)
MSHFLRNNRVRLTSVVALLLLVPAWRLESLSTPETEKHGPTPSASATASANLERSTPNFEERFAKAYGKLPISFELNRGQTDDRVKFLARVAGYTVFLTQDEAVLSLHQRHALAINKDKCGIHRIDSPSKIGGLIGSASEVSSAKFELRLIGENPFAEVFGVDPLPGKINYFIGDDPSKWREDIPTYSKVRFRNIYPGIDLVYYGNQQGRLEHDFIVAPNADPNAIAISVPGSLAVPAANGDLTVRTEAGSVTLQSPVVYQTVNGKRRNISASYMLAVNNQIRFQLGSFDRNLPLVIDPVLQYSGLLGGSDDDLGRAIAVDGSGNAYLTGGTYSTNFPLAHPFQATGGPTTGTTAFVSKINAAGTALVYSTYLGTNGSIGDGIAVDSSGRAYITGGAGSGLPLKNAHQQYPGTFSAFVTVLAPAGNSLVYSTYLGGSSQSFARSIALDSAQNAYIGGMGGINASGSMFIAKFNKTGILQYSSALGSDTNTEFQDLAVDGAGSVYITGFTWSSVYPVTANAYQKTCPNAPHTPCAFVTRFAASGPSMVYSTYLGGGPSNGSAGFAIAVDSSGNAYVTGVTGIGFPITKNAFQKVHGGGPGFDGFVTKLSPSGNGLIFSTYLGGNSNDNPTDIAVDQYRNVYVTGYAASPDFPLKASLQPFIVGGAYETFVTTLSGSGSSIAYYSTYFGNGADSATGFTPVAIAVDKALNVYIAGTSHGDIPTTPGALNTTTGGSDLNAFVAKLVIMDDLALGLSASTNTVASGGNLTYTIAVTSKGPDFGYNLRINDPLPAGTTFVSDSSGGGTCTAPAVGSSGTLHCTLAQLEKGQTYSVTLTVNVNAAAGSTLSNTATTVSNMQDFVPSNNSGTLTTHVQ